MEERDVGLQLPEAPFCVGEWLVEPLANRVSRGDTVHRLEPKVMEVLACLAQQPGQTVTKEQFMAEVWAGTIVTDDVLARCISELRKALGDRARKPEYVETIRKRGYALIAPVTPAPPEALPEGASGSSDGASTAVPELAPERTVHYSAPLRRRRPRRRIALGIIVATVVIVAVQQYVAARLQPLSSVPVTSFPGEETDPALSPDGEHIAFAWDRGDGEGFDLYVQNANDQAPVRLTSDAADEHSPAWSPDGRTIAFVRCLPEGCSVFAVAAQGGPERRLADLGAYEGRGLVWSPDGQTLAFSARRDATGAYGIVLLPIDGERPLRLTEPPATHPGDLDPAFSPDGRRLAFVRTRMDGRQDVCLVPVEGGEVRRLAIEEQGVTGLDWTSDGQHIVYAANRDGATGLWRVGLAGGNPSWVALAYDGGEVYQPSTARHARGITFARRSYRTDIAQIVRTRSGNRRPQPFLASTRWDSHPDVSPDGDRVAFVSTRTGHHEVWMTDDEGEALERLTTFEGPRVSTPRWSPDGRQIAFVARPRSHADLYVMEPGGEPRRLTRFPGDEVAPSWSRDGRWLYFASTENGGWQIWRIPAEGGDAEPITRHGGIAAAETPDGESLLVVRPDRHGLYRVALDRDVYYAEPIARLSPADWANWAVHEEGVYVLQRRDGGFADIVRVDLATRQPQWVATVRDVPEQPGLAIFPGGQRLLITQVERGDSDIALVADFR